jgi:hypothetical protein
MVSDKGRETVGDKYKCNVEAERIKPEGSTVMQTFNIMVQIPPDETAPIEQEKAKHGRPDAVKWRVKRTASGASPSSR